MRKQEAVTGHFNPDGKRETDVIWAEKQQLTKLKIADYSYYKEHEYCCMPNMMHRDGHGRFEGLTPEIAREFAKKVYAFGGFADDNNDKMYDLAQRMQQKEFKINKCRSKMGSLRYGGFKYRKKYHGP